MLVRFPSLHRAPNHVSSENHLHPPSTTSQASALLAVRHELSRIEKRLDELERAMSGAIEAVPPDHRASAKNLVHYVALRQLDLRELQRQLQEHGLSSLGRSESCVLGSVLEVLARAHESLALHGDDDARRGLESITDRQRAALSPETARYLLHQHTRDVLGPRPENRHIYIMVTAPSAREADAAWMERMLHAGMNVLRINCSHESAEEWASVVTALRQARRESGLECRITMDLAGPKIRTGPVSGAHRILTWKPERDDLGRPTAPARVIVSRASRAADMSASTGLTLDDATFATIREGDELRFRDARKKKRRLEVVTTGDDEIITEARSRAYVLDKTRARVVRDGKRVAQGSLKVLGPTSAAIDVRVGDLLVLARQPSAGRAPVRRADGSIETVGVVTCTLPAALTHLQQGHRVLFDDCRIGAVVECLDGNRDFVLRVVKTQKQTVKLRAEKGINLPDTEIDIPSLTEDDREALAFAVAHADAVGLSFVRRAEDVRALHQELDQLGRADIGTVLKIETRTGFENLPDVLLESLRRPPCAVMIARGDLAAEVGFERLAELQDEILWLCEASHVPAIWATQVLDTLARTGVPSRAEVTDAAASVAAECVMLNKGPFVEDAVRALSNILCRMEQHRYKKRSLFRKLHVSSFLPQAGEHSAATVEAR